MVEAGRGRGIKRWTCDSYLSHYESQIGFFFTFGAVFYEIRRGDILGNGMGPKLTLTSLTTFIE
jgi:hypothetical protein